MNNINQVKYHFFHLIYLSQYIHCNTLSHNLFHSFRLLEQVIDDKKRKENQKKQLYELFIYIAILLGIIIIILGGYNLYKKYVEKQAMNAINMENRNIINYNNSLSAASQEERQVYSYNAKVNSKYIGSEIESNNAQNNSFDYNHEERMEKIRKKYGNKMLIKILIKQQIECVIYDKNLGLEYGDICTICVNNFLENIEIYRTPCEHIFHKDCFNKYLKKINKKNKLTCPNCNQNLLINKKFLKLRHEKIKIKKLKKEKESVNNIETDKKELSDLEIISTNNKDMENFNLEDNTIINKNKDILFILKKRKIDIPQNIKRSATYVNIYNLNKNLEIKKEEKKNKEEEIYISNSNLGDDNIENKKDNISSLNIEDIDNTKNENILNLNIKKDKKKKYSPTKIKFSDLDNEINNNRINLKDFNSNRGFIDDKKELHDNIETTK